VQAREMCKPGRCASRGGVQARWSQARSQSRSQVGVQAREVCKPGRCAQAREVCKPGRCASQGGVQAREMCKPRRWCKPESVQAREWCYKSQSCRNIYLSAVTKVWHLFPNTRVRLRVTKKAVNNSGTQK